MIVPGMFVCSSFLISVCMFIVSKALLISSAAVIVRAGGAIWLNPFADVYIIKFVLRHISYSFIPIIVKMFDETIRNVFECSCYFVVECYGCV